VLSDVAKQDLGGLGEAADEVEHLTAVHQDGLPCDDKLPEEAGYGRWRSGWYTHNCGDDAPATSVHLRHRSASISVNFKVLQNATLFFTYTADAGPRHISLLKPR